MDNLKISSGLTGKLVAKFISKLLLKKTGIYSVIDINEITVDFDGDRALLHIDIDADVPKSEVIKLIDKM